MGEFTGYALANAIESPWKPCFVSNYIEEKGNSPLFDELPAVVVIPNTKAY